ncbi:hypothetical protein L6Q96_04330 [Candidatus Binatia bacterium]|nr:hypothetical protein [Candidatus Binatia bacterium]
MAFLSRCTVVFLVAWSGAAFGVTPAPLPTGAGQPLLTRAAGGGAPAHGLAAGIAAAPSPRFPVMLSPPDAIRQTCAQSCSVWDRLDLAMNRAAAWLSAFPTDELRFDAAVMLHHIRDTVDSDALTRAFDRARAVAEKDSDHPQRAFWNPAATAPAEHTAGWVVPTEPGRRVNVNRPLTEALHCRKNGWRPETTVYVCGPMRDNGGYETTHALWAIDIAFRRGCVDKATYERCVRAMHEELRAAQPAPFSPQATLDIDLYGERLLQNVMTGFADPVMNAWAATLMDLQQPDGSWGVATEGEPPYWRYHATAIGTWALAEWYRRMLASPALRPQ